MRKEENLGTRPHGPQANPAAHPITNPPNTCGKDLRDQIPKHPVPLVLEVCAGHVKAAT